MKSKVSFVILFFMLFVMFGGCKQAGEYVESGQEIAVFVGTYTGQGSAGIYVYKMDVKTGAMRLVQKVGGQENPSFLAVDSTKSYLYAVQEVGNFQGKNNGAIRSFKIDPISRSLSQISEQPSHGQGPCHIAVTPDGDFVAVANYSSGSIALYPVQDGRIQAASDTVQHVGSGPIANRQKGPHAHSVNPSADGRFLYAVDLGIDKILIYDLAAEPGKLTPASTPYARSAAGAGPRHFTFHPKGNFAYSINELNSTIAVYSRDAATGALTEIQTVTTLPADYSGYNSCADIHITPDGRFLYGSNRGHDSLAIFKIEDSGRLAAVGHQLVFGRTPRNFAIDPTGTFVLVANQDTDQIAIFRIDKETGELKDTSNRAQVSRPVCVVPVLM